MIEGLIIDSFAGGGGASTGIEMALARGHEQGLLKEQRFVDYAINHDAEAISMHAANHPRTKHLPCNIWQVEFDKLVGRRKVAFMWFSPDCKHFSKAKGGKPVKKNIRDLAWVVVKASRQVRPDLIMLENVEEFQDWGPLIFKRDAAGEVMNHPDTGEPLLMPCPDRKGETFKKWMGELRRLGYRIEWRELRACDYGTPTIRKRFFMIARRDGRKIVWPAPTHGDPKSEAVKSGKLLPWRTAAEIIDWSLECPSIFLSPDEVKAWTARTGKRVKRPLAQATEDRVAKGVDRYVIKAEKPFIVNLTHQGGDRNESLDEPLNTVTGAHRGEKALVSPVFVGVGGRAGQSPPRSGGMPMNTLTAKADGALVAPILARVAHGEVDKNGKKRGQGTHVLSEPLPTQMASPEFSLVSPTFVSYGQQGGGNRSAEEPLHTATASDGDQNQIVVPTLVTTGYGEREGQEPRVPGLEHPLGTVVGGGVKHAVSAPVLATIPSFEEWFSKTKDLGGTREEYDRMYGDPALWATERAENEALAEAITPHLTKFRSGAVGSDANEPVPTVTANSFIERPGGAVPIGVVAPHLMTMRNAQKPFNGADEPTHTVTSMGAHLHLVAAFMAQHNIDGRTGQGNPGHSVEKPVSTILHSGSHQGLAAVHMLDMHGSDMRAASAEEPLRALTAGGFHAAQVAAFLIKYYSTDQDPRLEEALHSITTKDRFGLVTVTIHGQPYIIVDIGLRMLIPRELFRAQGFPDSYIIDRGAVIHIEADGTERIEWVDLSQTAQVRMCGNSVCPQLADALVWANLVDAPAAYIRTKEERPVDGAPWEFPLWAEEVAA